MALEPGPAVLFDLSTIDLSLEPLLDPADYDIVTAGLDQAGTDIDTLLQPAIDANASESQDVFNWYTILAVAEDIIGGGELEAPDPNDDLIVQGVADSDQAIEDALTSIPQTLLTPDGGVGGSAVTPSSTVQAPAQVTP